MAHNRVSVTTRPSGASTTGLGASGRATTGRPSLRNRRPLNLGALQLNRAWLCLGRHLNLKKEK